MKKIFFGLTLFLAIIVKVPAYGDYIQQWNQYCPAEYLSAEYINYNQLAPSEKVGYFVKKYILPGQDYVLLNNYWVERRNDFEMEIDLCNKLPENSDRISCYIQVGKVQQNETKQFKKIQQLERELSYERRQRIQYEQDNRDLKSKQ